jgi:CRP-like cAMP-binding protein
MTSEVEIIPPEEWYRGLKEDPKRCLNLALQLQDKLRMMQQRIDQLTEIAPAEKLRKLEEWFRACVSNVPLTDLLTQDEIGQFLGLRRETINRLLRRQAETRLPEGPKNS